MVTLGLFEAAIGFARGQLTKAIAATGVPLHQAESMVLAALRDAGALG